MKSFSRSNQCQRLYVRLQRIKCRRDIEARSRTWRKTMRQGELQRDSGGDSRKLGLSRLKMR